MNGIKIYKKNIERIVTFKEEDFLDPNIEGFSEVNEPPPSDTDCSLQSSFPRTSDCHPGIKLALPDVN